MLLAVWVVALLSSGPGDSTFVRPPFVVGSTGDVVRIFVSNMLVLGLHALACVAGFIAGSALPTQARRQTGVMRAVHERGPRAALGFAIGATAFSLLTQAYSIGRYLAHAAFAFHTPPGLVLAGLAPHALAELVALFLPLAAWVLASRRGEWDQLLAATLVTVVLAVPILVLTAVWEVYVAPHTLAAILGYG
jgi:hypothetical protein